MGRNAKTNIEVQSATQLPSANKKRIRYSYRAITFYHRFVDYFQTLLRSIGLAIATFRNADEPPKVVATSSRWLALARCAIHIVPATVSCTLAAINIRGHFIGRELEGTKDQDGLKVGLLQVAAKIQELLIVSSMGTMVFQSIRSHIMFRDGLPLGLLVSGFSFSQLSYFYSAEFWGGLAAPGALSRWLLVMLVVLGGMLATFAGPAAAVLMIPVRQEWLAGGGIFWLNGTDEVLWPTTLDVDYYSNSDCASNISSQLNDPKCPSAGYFALHNHYKTWWNNFNTVYEYEMQDYSMRKTMYSAPPMNDGTNSWAWTTHHATVNMQDAMRQLHFNALMFVGANSRKKFDPDRLDHLHLAETTTFELETKVPVVRTICMAQGGFNMSDDVQINFPPRFSQQDEIMSLDRKGLPTNKTYAFHPDPESVNATATFRRHLSKRGLLENNKSLADVKLFSSSRRSVAIPVDLSDRGDSLGLVILLADEMAAYGDPGGPMSNHIACNIDAMWTNATSILEIPPGKHLAFQRRDGRSRNLASLKLGHNLARKLGYQSYQPRDDSNMQHIKLSPEWFDLVSPVLPEGLNQEVRSHDEGGSGNRTSFEDLFRFIYDPVETRWSIFEDLINMNVADGLSRSGMIANINSTQFLQAEEFNLGMDRKLAKTLVSHQGPTESFREPESVKGHSKRMVMKAKYTGYALGLGDAFSYFCCAALLAHALLAFCHTVYLMFRPVTSGSWDTVLEMLVLSLMSRPPSQGALNNTSGGVNSFKTMRLTAWVESEDQASRGNELRLRLKENATESRQDSLKPLVQKKYGKDV